MSDNRALTPVDHRRLTRFGDELARRRTEVGLSQSQLAAIAGIGRPMLNNYEQGARRPQRSALELIVTALFAVKRRQVGLPVERFGWLDDAWEDLYERVCRLLGTTVGDPFADDGRAFFAPNTPGASIVEDVTTEADLAQLRARTEPIMERAREWVFRHPMKGRR